MLAQLEREFQHNQYLVGRERSDLAVKLNLSETQVPIKRNRETLIRCLQLFVGIRSSCQNELQQNMTREKYSSLSVITSKYFFDDVHAGESLVPKSPDEVQT